jgi:hypothetical protein
MGGPSDGCKYAFLHKDLQEEIYLEQPLGYVQNDSSLVCHLNKSLYGLKQAPRAWYAKMDSFLIATGFYRFHYDPNVYTKKVESHLIILVLNLMPPCTISLLVASYN